MHNSFGYTWPMDIQKRNADELGTTDDCRFLCASFSVMDDLELIRSKGSSSDSRPISGLDDSFSSAQSVVLRQP